MTPEEKAKELMQIFNYNRDYAIACVDEILKSCYLEKEWFFEEVKQEIEKL